MKHRILILDDSLTVRMDLREAFEGAGFETVLVARLAEARATLRAGPAFDLAVLDVVLPDGDGVELLAELRAAPETAATPVILLSSEVEVASRIAGLEKGADDYIGKPYESLHLVQRARELIGLPAPVRERPTVLVIDDSLTFCEEMREELEAAGYEPVVAATGEEGLRKAAELEPDAIIIDGVLPGIDGASVVRRIRLDPALQRTPCLFLTGSERGAGEVAALDAGADAYIRKGESPRVILGRLSALVRASRSVEMATPATLPPAVGIKQILVLSGDRATIQWVTPVLRQASYDPITCASESEAFKLLSLQKVDCILCDVESLSSPVLDVCHRIRSSPLLDQVPLIIVTRIDDRERMLETMAAGADDWIAADQRQPKLLLARLRALLRRKDVEDRERRIRQAMSQRTYELEQANHELRLYQEIVERMPIGISVVTWETEDDPASFRLIKRNPAAAAATGVDLEHSLGRALLEDGAPLFESAIAKDFAAVARSGESRRLAPIRRGETHGPEEVHEVWISPLGERTAGAFFENVTERERMEQQMRAAQRLEAVGRLAGGVAHDFNNVLTVIQSYAEFLGRGFTEGDRRRDDIDVILDATGRAARLTAQLLAFSRRQVQELAVIDLNRTVEEVDKILRRLLGEDIDLLTRLAPDLAPVKVDPGQLEQVLLNLAVNARDAMSGGGHLTIETQNVHLDETYGAAKNDDIPPGDYVMVAVTDTGTGMDDEVMQHIFEPFFTTKAQDKGTGLGLATAYGIVRQSGGFMWVYSEPGIGSSFKIYLPRATAAVETRSRRATIAPTGGAETILLVEDEELVRKASARILEGHGYHVLAASQGKEALQIAWQYTDDIHLLLTDVVMPGINGRELFEQLAEVHPETAVAYMSGYTDDSIVHHGVLEEGVAFVQKPFSPASLLRKIREILDSSGVVISQPADPEARDQ
jgi:DNA-binding response OmpR family regulator/nitrogen-specific signal transduction histidine kinase